MCVEDLFYGVVTKENVGRLEVRLMHGDKGTMEEGVAHYSEEEAIDLLSQLYEHLEIPVEKEADWKS